MAESETAPPGPTAQRDAVGGDTGPAAGAGAHGTDGTDAPARPRNPYVAALVAWLMPGAGHLMLGRIGRGLLFFALVVAMLAIGLMLEGKLWSVEGSLQALESTRFLYLLGTLGCAGSGIPFAVLNAVGYTGDLVAPGYEYGGAFVLTAGLMNLLLVLDAWDIARGAKE